MAKVLTLVVVYGCKVMEVGRGTIRTHDRVLRFWSFWRGTRRQRNLDVDGLKAKVKSQKM